MLCDRFGLQTGPVQVGTQGRVHASIFATHGDGDRSHAPTRESFFFSSCAFMLSTPAASAVLLWVPIGLPLVVPLRLPLLFSLVGSK